MVKNGSKWSEMVPNGPKWVSNGVRSANQARNALVCPLHHELLEKNIPVSVHRPTFMELWKWFKKRKHPGLGGSCKILPSKTRS